MKLSDLRRAAVRRQFRIRYALPGGLTCTVDEHGVARVEGMSGKPDFNLEAALAAVTEFDVEPLGPKEAVRRLSLRQLAELAGAAVDDSSDHEE